MPNHDEIVAQLVRDRGRALLGYAYLLTLDMTAAEDLTQGAFERAVARGRNLDDLWAAESYVRRTILNLYLDSHRRRRRWVSSRHLVATADHQPDPVITPIQLDVRAALADLPPRERACVVLRFYDDLSVRHIAERIGISEGAVKRYLSDGTRRLGTLLGPQTTDDDDEHDVRLVSGKDTP